MLPPDTTPVEDQSSTAPVPTPMTLRLRTFVPWQVVRFFVINLHMLRLLWRGHHQ